MIGQPYDFVAGTRIELVSASGGYESDALNVKKFVAGTRIELVTSGL